MWTSTDRSCVGPTAWLAVLCLLSLPVAHGQVCLTSINTMSVREALAFDTSLRRTYNLCPFTTYNVGTLNYDYELIEGQDMIPLRPNIHVKCGDNGSHEDSCRIVGGDVQVDGTSFFGLDHDSLDNVILEGLTFVGVSRHNVWINKPGDVHFINCVFEVSERSGSGFIGQSLRPTNCSTG